MSYDKPLTKDKRRTTIILSPKAMADMKRFLADKRTPMKQFIEDAITEKLRRDTEVLHG